MQLAQSFIGIGANLGDRQGTIQNALERLGSRAGIIAMELSPVYESDPVGVLDQPLFLNLVAGVETTLKPEALLRELLAIEQELGRKRIVRWGPRSIDLDLLLFAGETRQDPGLQLPHPRMFERPFVLEPLRALLWRPRFQGAAWDGLRVQLAGLPVGGGIRPWSPP
jgi:2-amino-4-hydroxy-6-hydroxymethyldihydropteridine diphosphokinase